MVTKLGRMVTYYEGRPLFEIKSPVSQYLWLSNFSDWWYIAKSSHTPLYELPHMVL